MDPTVANPSSVVRIKTPLDLLNQKERHIKVVEKQQDPLTGLKSHNYQLKRASNIYALTLIRSSSSFDSASVIKSQSSLFGQSSTETNPDHEFYSVKEGDPKPVSISSP